MPEEKKTVKKTFSTIGIALALLTASGYVVGMFTSLLWRLTAGQEEGIGGALRELLSSSWFQIAGTSLLHYAIILPIFLWLLRKIPGGCTLRQKKLHMQDFLMFYVMVMGGGYIFSFIGVFINLAISILKGGSFAALNPVNSLMVSMTPAVAVYVAILAPVIEEFIFRGVVIGKTKQYGERTAVIFSAVMFGLLHGNIAQFLYATVIGLILGYVAVKTGGIFYTCLLHMMVNGFSTLVALLIPRVDNANIAINGAFSLLLLFFLFGCMIMSVVFVCVNWKHTYFVEGAEEAAYGRRGLRGLAWKNAGVLLFAVLCVGEMAAYIVTS